MSDSVLVERRFRGPEESANGGYACGLVAAVLEPGPAVEVTLRAPPPINRRMRRAAVDGKAELRDSETLVAEGRPVAAPELAIPDPISLAAAEAARRDSPLHRHHPFASCFVCGPERELGDGMRVVCGPVAGRELVAAPWQTDGWMAASDGTIHPELVWSALDCPSGLTGTLLPDPPAVSVLGRLTAILPGPLQTGPTYVAIGWPIEREGRKLLTGSAILAPDGEPLAWARATWIELREQPA